MLAVDACNEGAHRMLMRCYARLGQAQLDVICEPGSFKDPRGLTIEDAVAA
jgi:hypothetical protein